MEFLSRDNSRTVAWGHGDNGGVVLTRVKPTSRAHALSFNPDDILGGDDKTVDIVVKLLNALPSDGDRGDALPSDGDRGNVVPSDGNALSDFFITLFRDLILTEQKEVRLVFKSNHFFR